MHSNAPYNVPIDTLTCPATNESSPFKKTLGIDFDVANLFCPAMCEHFTKCKYILECAGATVLFISFQKN